LLETVGSGSRPVHGPTTIHQNNWMCDSACFLSGGGLADIPEIQPAGENAMSHIEPKPHSEYPLWLRWFFKRQERKYGRTLSPSWLWGRHPKLFAGMLSMLGIFQAKSYPIDTPLRSLISVRVAQLNGCWFCVDLNAYNMLKAAGVPEKAEKVSSWRKETIYSGKERAALEWAEMMTDTGRDNDPTLIAELKKHFDEDAIVALTAWIAFQNLSAKFNAALGAEENSLCKLPDVS
jgi:AhpD family alkylhydroperoxidase